MPAVCETAAGTPSAASAATIALIGSVEKCPTGPPGTTGSSTGLAPALSGIRASRMLIATRSGVIAVRPAASPTAITRRGRSLRTASASSSEAAPNSTGSSTPSASMPRATRAGTASRTASQDSFVAAPLKGAKPVSSTSVVMEPA